MKKLFFFFLLLFIFHVFYFIILLDRGNIVGALGWMCAMFYNFGFLVLFAEKSDEE